jgi:hypothetical protein
MNNIDEIISAAQQLKAQGKNPSVALLKPLVSAPLPTIIKGLKLWQQNPQQIVSNTSKEAPVNDTDANELLASMLEKALQPIKQELKEIKQQLAQLKAEKHSD